MSLRFSDEDFFDPIKGIYVDGPDSKVRNYDLKGADSEKPVYFELIENGTVVFSANGGVRIHGGSTRKYPQKSLKICAKEKYESKYFSFRFFGDEGFEKYRCFLLRNSGNDWRKTMLRDALMQSLVKDTGIDTQAYRPSVVYLNGKYWGIHNIREVYDEYYFSIKHNVPTKAVTILEASLENNEPLEVSVGDKNEVDKFLDMVTFAQNNDLASDQNYTRLKEFIDIDNFVKYNVAQIYFNNTDWPGNNTKIWRFNSDRYDKKAPENLDGRWRWLIFDTDEGFGLQDDRAYAYDTYKELPSVYAPDENDGFLFSNLLKNEEFKNKYLLYLADYLNSIFLPTVVNSKIDQMQSEIRPEMVRHSALWGPQAEFIYKSNTDWKNNVKVLKDYANKRPNHLRLFTANYFNTDGVYKIKVEPFESNSGYLRINTLTVVTEENGWEGHYFKRVPIDISVVARAGFMFSGWEIGPKDLKQENLGYVTSEDLVLKPLLKPNVLGTIRLLFGF